MTHAPLPPGPRSTQSGRHIHERASSRLMKEDTLYARTLGATGPTVSALGLGAMGISGAYGPADRAESVTTLHVALDAGLTVIDTGDFYASDHNELLLAEALRGRERGSYQLSVKFGMPATSGGGTSGSTAAPQR